MDIDHSGSKIDKLTSNNYHAWKQRILHVLALKDLEDYVDPPDSSTEINDSWVKKDRKAQALIGLSLSDQILESTRDVKSCHQMWKIIQDIFERHTLLNKLSARRNFYTASKEEGESVLNFSNRVRHLASTLKSMNVEIVESEMAMTLLNGLPDEYSPLICALDALGSEESQLDFEFVKGRVMQEEQRINMRKLDALKRTGANSLVANEQRSRPKCDFCGKLGHRESRCWKKFPEKNPHKRKPALVATLTDEEPVICLMTKYSSQGISKNSEDWYIDSGCSNHMTFNKSLFSSYSSGSFSEVDFGNLNKAKIAGIGDITIQIKQEGKLAKLNIKNVLHVPDLGYQLLSVQNWDQAGYTTIFENKICRIKHGRETLATGTLTNGLYKLDLDTVQSSSGKALAVQSLRSIHEQLAHVSPHTIMQMKSLGLIKSPDIERKDINEFLCEGCLRGKGHRDPIPKRSTSKSKVLLELIHSDVNGPLEPPSHGGSRYFVTFIDDFSRWTVVYPMRKKSEVFEHFKSFHSYAEKHTGQKLKALNIIRLGTKTHEQIKTLRTDNGGEYLSQEFSAYLLSYGIQHQLTIAYTPQQNGVAERMNRTLLDLVRSCIHSKNMDKKFWAEALQTVVFIRNRVPSSALENGITPFELWTNKKPDLSNLHVFGSSCWYVIPKSKLKKLDSRSRKALFLGYLENRKGYKLWDTDLQKPVISRDVTFETLDNQKDHELTEYPNHTSMDQGGDNVDLNDLIASESSEKSEQNDSSLDQTESLPSSPEQSPMQKSKSKRPVRECTLREPRKWWLSNNANLAKALSARIVPLSYKVATKPENIDFWTPGIEKEEQSLLKNNTWKLVERKPGMHVLPCKYVFKIKNGGPKARVVILGNLQIYGLDYFETFSPVIKMITIRTILALAALLGLEVDQMDVVTAFLNGDLDEIIYMEIPEGLRNESNKDKVCQLLKALYGLKQAPRQWYAKMHHFLIDDLGFVSSPNDPCLYVRKASCSLIIIGLYVDDLLIAGNDRSEINNIKSHLSRKFEMKDLGEAKSILGIQITRNKTEKKIFISQEEYATEVLSRFSMINSNPISTPMDRAGIPDAKSEPLDPSVPYRQAIGSLMYLMISTRPDIAYSIRCLSQYCENPEEKHWAAVKRVFRYIRGTSTKGILYDGNKHIEPIGYSDSDYAGCKESRKSTSAYIFLIAGGAVSWKSKKQTCIATSSCEAEYIALCFAAKEAIWLSRIVQDIRSLDKSKAISIGVDNEGAIVMANNAVINDRSKHISVQYHFVREAVKNSQITLRREPSHNQLADPLTKPLARILHSKHSKAQGIVAFSYKS